MIKIFEIIKASKDIYEPIHTQIISELLKLSKDDNNSTFYNEFLEHIGISNAEKNFKIVPEYLLQSKRIDILLESSKTVIGIEIKISEQSVVENQLEQYLSLMKEMFSDKNIVFCYLTPFNEKYFKDISPKTEGGILKSIECFKSFEESIVDSDDLKERLLLKHISWNEVSKLICNDKILYNDSVVKQYVSYIKEYISSEELLNALINPVGRAFASFIGEAELNHFIKELDKQSIKIVNHTIDVKKLSIQQVKGFMESLKRLLSPVHAEPVKWDEDLEKQVLNSISEVENEENIEKFRIVLSKSKELNLRCRGKKNIGLWTKNKKAKSSRLSVFTLRLNGKIEIGKPR